MDNRTLMKRYWFVWCVCYYVLKWTSNGLSEEINYDVLLESQHS